MPRHSGAHRGPARFRGVPAANHVLTDGGKGASVSYKGGGHDGTIVIEGSKVLQNSSKQPREMVADAKRAKARLAAYAKGASGAFDLKLKGPGGGPVKIDWDCELATLDVIIECGSFDIVGCGEAVRHQQCECLREDPPGGCD